jgi:hypothetical protein
MRDITLFDIGGIYTLRMCERHFKQYQGHLNNAYLGGTSYIACKTTKNICEVCKRRKEAKGNVGVEIK